MKIIFLTDNFPPEVNAPATRTFEHCTEWVKQGAEVTVITCFPNFPQGKIYEGYKNKLYQKESINGITVIRVWSFMAANKGVIKRLLDFNSYAIMAFIVGVFCRTDLIIGTSPQFFTAISARFLSLFKRKPWVMEVRDIYPEALSAVGLMDKKSVIYKFLEFLEINLYKSANHIVVVTNSFKRELINKGIAESKISVCTNGVNLSKFQPQLKDQEILMRLKLNNKFIISYIGTHGLAHALTFILDCASQELDNDIHFVFIGDGAEKENLKQKAKKLKLQNVTFLPFVNKEEIKSYISISDVALVNLKKSVSYKDVIPSKIFENACMLKPILLGVDGESKALIEKYNAGECFDPENKISFRRSLELIMNVDKYKLGCQKLAIDYNRNNIAIKLLNILKKTTNGI